MATVIKPGAVLGVYEEWRARVVQKWLDSDGLLSSLHRRSSLRTLFSCESINSVLSCSLSHLLSNHAA